VRELKVIAFTHKTTDIKNIGKLHIDADNRKERLSRIKELGVSELMYLSTCNRVEFVFVHDEALTDNFLYSFFAVFNPDWDDKDIKWAMSNCTMFEGLQSARHIFHIASSLDSLVVGEREIITQVRKSFDECSKLGLTGDIIRLLINKTIESAKEVYTKTNIARNPVSIVSLAYRKLRELNIKENSRILVVGAGETNTNMCRFLSKHGLKNLTMFNRTLSKAEFLTNHIGGTALPLAELEKFDKGFDLIVTCTGSDEPIITSEIYKILIGNDTSKKTIVDLAIPYDVAPEVIEDNSINYIEIEGLKSISAQNIKEREKELAVCNALIEEQLIAFKQAFKERQVEIVMREVPQKIKEIKEFALTQVFAKEMEEMEDESKEVLDKMLAYIEKKYISVPMKMAKEILLDTDSDKS
jgi:glutamyl-tRNA reductase